MCKGAFGGVSSISSGEPHEYLCVQSMDGMLSVFEHESFSLSCFLPKVLLPGPFKYIQKSDSFITVNSSWELESYKYQILATSASTLERKTNDNNANSTNVKQKKILPEFTYNLGEAAIDIEIVNYNNSSNCSILVLGERSLYCFSDTCVLKYMKKFDFNPSCFCAYPIISSSNNGADVNSKVNFIVATHSKLLFVHEDVKVKWAAQVEHVPIQIAVTKINDMSGMIVMLSEDGKLKCSYLGTEPAFLNPTLKEDASKPFNFDTAEKEYRSLQAQIKSSIMNTGSVITTVNRSGLVITVDVPKQLDQITPLNRNKDTELKDPLDAIPSITCTLTLKSMETVSSVKVNLNCCLPLVAVPDTFSFASMGSVPYNQEVCFYMKTNHIPSSLNVTACASYSYAVNGAPRITETKFRLPLKLIMKSGQHASMTKMEQNQEEQKSIDKKTQQSGLKKITIETNKPCANLTEIFPEFSASFSQANGNTLVAQFFGHSNTSISIQGAKSGSNKYRLQSDTLESLWLVAQEFIMRLKAHFKKQSQDVDIYFKETLPTEEFKLVIDKHLELRQSAESSKVMLEQCCIQFRAIQKRLLSKFKDKSPTSLDNMDALLEATHRQIVSVADSYLSTQKELTLLTNTLNCIGSLFVLLVSLVFRLDEESLHIFESVLTNRLGDKQDIVNFLILQFKISCSIAVLLFIVFWTISQY
jgi:Bardet-Biedl syndrome 9 protein